MRRDFDNKPKKVENKADPFMQYTVMNDDALYHNVRNFMFKLGVTKNIVDISKLYERFGEENIKRLVQKSYLIKIGKGVTAGR